MIFSTKTISNPLSVGEKLKQARLQTGLSLDQVARKINISSKYLEAIESGNHQQLPGDVYAKSFLKAYIKFLDLDEAGYLNQFSSERNIHSKTSQGKDFKKPVARVSRLNLLVAPKILRGGIILLLAMTVLVYLGGKIKAIVAPPVLTVTSPADSVKITDSFIAVAGKTELATTLSINGQQVATDEQGNFDELIDLQSGVNIIEITAEKRHGRQTTVYRQVIVETVVVPTSSQSNPAVEVVPGEAGSQN